MLNPLVGIVAVQEVGEDRGRCVRHSLPLGVPGQGQGGERRVAHHEHHQHPGTDAADFGRNPLNQAGEFGVDALEPHHRRDAPEETVEQVDAPPPD